MTLDLSEFEELGKPRKLRCTVGIAVETLKGTEREQFCAALASPAIRHSAIEAWLERRGIKVCDKTISRHRNGRCSC